MPLLAPRELVQKRPSKFSDKTSQINVSSSDDTISRIKSSAVKVFGSRLQGQNSTGEFDPGSERTLAARLTHASRTRKGFGPGKVAHGCVTRRQSSLERGITFRKRR